MFLQLFFFLSCLVLIQAGNWTEAGKFVYFLLDVSLNDPNASYAAAAVDGVGSMIMKSGDLGKHWKPVVERDGLLDIACGSLDSDSAVGTSVVGKTFYTLDGGSTFKDSIVFLPGRQSMSRGRTSQQYGAPGGEGLWVSDDKGVNWRSHVISALNSTRYAAMPTSETWYITAGLWDTTTTALPLEKRYSNHKHLSSKISLFYDEVHKNYGVHFKGISQTWIDQQKFKKHLNERLNHHSNKHHEKMEHSDQSARENRMHGSLIDELFKHGSMHVIDGENDINIHENKMTEKMEKMNVMKNGLMTNRHNRKSLQTGIWGEIWKTSDGGSTWTLSFSNYGEFYFNAIDCCDENTCYAVAEGDTSAGSSQPGTRIFMTTDGDTWKQVYFNPDDAASLMGVHCLTDSEAWVGGGILAERDFKGTFLHTTDGGQNWDTVEVATPILFMDMSNDGSYGVADGVTIASEGVVYSFQ